MHQRIREVEYCVGCLGIAIPEQFWDENSSNDGYCKGVPVNRVCQAFSQSEIDRWKNSIYTERIKYEKRPNKLGEKVKQ